MCDLKRTLDATGHCVLEMPSGTGKTVSLLSLIVSYQQFYPTKRKLIYCSRTVPEIEKALSELKRLMAYRISQAETPEQRIKEEAFTGLGLTSRKNLQLKRDGMTRATIRYVLGMRRGLNDMEEGALIPAGIHTLADISNMGRERTTCPYFTIRRMMPFVDVIIYSFHYLLDPKVAEQVSKELSKDSIVVFDEAHNIEAAARSVTRLGEKIDEIKATDANRLQEEYEKLVEGLQETENDRAEDVVMANPVLPDDLLKEAVPGNIRKAEHFIAFLKRLVEYLKACYPRLSRIMSNIVVTKTRMRVLHVVAETPLSFLQHLKDITFCAERLQSLIRTLELTQIDEYSSLQKVANFATLVSTYEKGKHIQAALELRSSVNLGFLLILEPFEGENTTVPNPIFHFTCLDPSLAIKPVFERFSSVVITSGTISPLDMYPKMLQFTPVVQETYPMTLTRNCFLPLVITRGSDQVAISSRFEVRNDPSVVRNFGSILIEYCKIVPDGVVAFFPSYLYMESIVAAWHDMGILSEVWKNKLIFVETPDANETSVALENYRKACDNGRGAVLLSVARGKVSEGIDFDHNYGRAVIMFGIPYQYTESRILKARLEYLRDAYRIRESEFLGFDAMRNAAQCVGRVLRGKTDWGLMIFADKRFARADKRSKLPRWINQYITESASNLSTDMALVQSKLFMRTISQSHDVEQTGVSLWTKEDIEAHQAKLRAMDPADVEMNEDKDEEDEYEGGISDAVLANVDLDDM
ncbi:DNA repair helicase [Rhizoctonia solani]|uniref:DNA 5'-3' helicase n=1 Tax=Rhizoctonia solani TaxID=456999 RepID=A0A8H7HD10_9AGAM|nr:DNA repair helicase [Rhizoctonia solani]